MKAYTVRWEPRALRELEEAQTHTDAGRAVVLDEELDGAVDGVLAITCP